jgi:hypothetical protein
MTVVTEFFEHKDFGGASQTFTTQTNSRWHWIKFGSTLSNKVSSMRSHVVSGRASNVYAFKNNNFTGDFASLNVPLGWTCWWSNVGSQMNDDIESALILRRNAKEVVQALKALIAPDFKTEFDKEAAGQAHRDGEPKIYGVFFPSYDPNAMLVRIEQNLVVELDCWWDYSARAQFDLQFSLTSDGLLDGFCKWLWVWVEGGIFSQDVYDGLVPKMSDACDTLTEKLRDKLALLNLGAALSGFKFGSVYVLPGAQPSFPPSGPFGRIGNSLEDCCLVVTRTD